MKNYLLARLSERSTWAGLIAVIGAFGIWHGTPEQTQAITALAIALFGGFSTFAPDRMQRPRLQRPPDEPVDNSDDLGERITNLLHPDER